MELGLGSDVPVRRLRGWRHLGLVRRVQYGYTFEDAPFSPCLGLKANIISGDNDSDDADLQTFNPLFPKAKYFGELSLLGPENLINLHSTLDLQLGDGWSLGGAAVFYCRESTDDGIYDVGGNLVRNDGGSDERFIGTQAEVVLTYQQSLPARSASRRVHLPFGAFAPHELHNSRSCGIEQ